MTTPTRVIKFRAWSSGKMWYSGKDGHFTLKWQNKNQITDGLWLIYDEDNGKSGTGENRPTLMQFTGFTDRHGKEIYEGDIVRGGTTENKDGVKNLNLVVEYNRGVFEPIAYMIDDAIEVIGNVWENGGLL